MLVPISTELGSIILLETDEPGLGKTITVLSLILQTSGLTVLKEESAPATNASPITEQEEIFRAYWQESMPPDFRRSSLLSLVNRFAQQDKLAIYVPVTHVKKKIQTNVYVEFEPFQQDMLYVVLMFLSKQK